MLEKKKVKKNHKSCWYCFSLNIGCGGAWCVPGIGSRNTHKRQMKKYGRTNIIIRAQKSSANAWDVGTGKRKKGVRGPPHLRSKAYRSVASGGDVVKVIFYRKC